MSRVPPPSSHWLPKVVSALPAMLRRHRVVEALICTRPRARVATFEFNGSAMITADLTDAAARQVMLSGTFEPEFFAVVTSFVLPNTAVLGVGANAGFCTFGLTARTSPDARVAFHLFEANAYLCEILARSSGLYPGHDITVSNGCVTDRPGVSRLHIVPDHWGGSFVTDAPDGQPAPNIVLDDYLAERQWPLVSIMKVDIEGHERQALRGLERSLERGRVGAMYVEVSGGNLQRAGSSAAELIEQVRALGCEWFWCKPVDLDRRTAECVDVVPHAGAAPVRLARLDRFPPDYQTDLLAISRAGPFAPILHRFPE